MGLFSKRREANEASRTTTSAFVGRKFSSSLAVEACIANFRSAAEQCYPIAGDLLNLAWSPPDPQPEFESTQGGPPPSPPRAFVGYNLKSGSQIGLAVWNGSVSYGDDGTTGSREMWFVPPTFDGSPIEIAGVWKRLDPSLSSIGTVESPYWGG